MFECKKWFIILRVCWFMSKSLTVILWNMFNKFVYYDWMNIFFNKNVGRNYLWDEMYFILRNIIQEHITKLMLQKLKKLSNILKWWLFRLLVLLIDTSVVLVYNWYKNLCFSLLNSTESIQCNFFLPKLCWISLCLFLYYIIQLINAKLKAFWHIHIGITWESNSFGKGIYFFLFNQEITIL